PRRPCSPFFPYTTLFRSELLLAILLGKAINELLIVVDLARDDVEEQPLRRLRLAIHEQRQRFRRGVAQPFVDGEAVALRLRYLLDRKSTRLNSSHLGISY